MHSQLNAQNESAGDSEIKKIQYKYTFEGMKDSTEISIMTSAVLKLKGVVFAEVIFKSPQHQYALLKVEVQVQLPLNENSSDITGPSDLKKIISRLGYIPAECKTIQEN